MTSLRCSSKLTESTIKGHIKDNDTQMTLTARADTQRTLTAGADTQMTLTARANTQMTLTARTNTQVTLTAPSSFCAPSSFSLSSLLSLLRCSFSIFFCLLLNVSLISFASSASFFCSFSLHILPSCSSSPSSSLASCVALQTQNRQKNSTTNVNETKFKLKSLRIL